MILVDFLSVVKWCPHPSVGDCFDDLNTSLTLILSTALKSAFWGARYAILLCNGFVSYLFPANLPQLAKPGQRLLPQGQPETTEQN